MSLFPSRKSLFMSLLHANSEAEVRQRILQELDYDTGSLEEGNVDFLHENILIEFKHDLDLSQKEGDRSKVLAQALYYCNAIYTGGKKRVPAYIVLIDKNEFIFYERQHLEFIYKNDSLFQTGNPSSPNDAIVELCKKVASDLYIFSSDEEHTDQAVKQLRSIINRTILTVDDITEFNISSVYSSWSNTFEQFLDTKAKDERTHVFRKDCGNEGQIFTIESDLVGREIINILFDVNGEIMKIERCQRDTYEDFWKGWKRLVNKKEQDKIFAKAADLFDTSSRRQKGQFYTPTNLAKHGWTYLEKEFGENFWVDGTWRIWDCCCGEGGLAINVIPHSALRYTYLSSLDNGEIDYVRGRLPMCRNIWKMDFLNTLIKDFPEDVKRDMGDPNIKWLFFINPPYGEGSSGKLSTDAEWYKAGVSQTLVKEQMAIKKMSRESKEKYAQFLFRIEKEFKKKYVLGCYTTMKVFISKEYKTLREFWEPQFKGGLICCANKWHQGFGAFPSVFSVFDCRTKGHWGKITYDILEYDKKHPEGKGHFKGTKTFVQEDTKRSFRDYFFKSIKLSLDEATVVQSNGLKPFDKKTKANNFRPKGTLASAGFRSAFMRNQNFSWMVSGNIWTHTVFINHNNYKKVLCGLGLYWSIKPSWKNNADFLSAPSRELAPQEESDAILMALVHTKNRTTTAKLPYTVIKTNKGMVANGGIVENKLNPFDKKRFDWSECSDTGKKTLRLYKDYCETVIQWRERDTVLGKGVWEGLYQYHRIVPLPKGLVEAIEELRINVEKTAWNVCF